MKRPARVPLQLSESLHKRLNAYAFAATAAGVSALSLTPSAEGKIIYTPIHKVIGAHGVYPLDLNHDGIADFLIMQSGSNSAGVINLYIQEATRNGVQGYSTSFRGKYADALKRGAQIGPREQFFTSTNIEGMAFAFVSGKYSGSGGQWRNVSNRYLGLKFKIDNKTHYGWARLSVKFKLYQITATLTGYAYETTPDEGILAGQTTSGELPPQPATSEPAPMRSEPKTLGTLARGANPSFRSNP